MGGYLVLESDGWLFDLISGMGGFLTLKCDGW